KLDRHRGHFFNWYALDDLRVLEPPYVSAVDSGNLAGHLLALATALEAADAPEQRERLDALAADARTIANGMDFTLFYDTRRKLRSIGYAARERALDGSAYHLLA